MRQSVRNILPYVLKPLSWLYGCATDFRNWLFDHDLLKSEQFDVPVVSIGNITVGGTGKTPHVEYIVSMLASSYNTVVLSRGYKRKTKGFIWANSNSTPESIGDEPLQIFRKFGNKVKVAVCESRTKGVKEIVRQFPDTRLILLDDSFQHRYIKPKVNILLMDYTRPIYKDNLLPLGRLRESKHNLSRADFIVVTKCPLDLQPIYFRIISKDLGVKPYQKLFFSTIRYGLLSPVFPEDHPYHVDLSSLTAQDTVILVTGVANPRGFIRHFKPYPFKVIVEHFPDHHDFSRQDLLDLQKKFKSEKGERKIIITTEKDAVRMAFNPYFPVALKPFVFYLPIAIRMLSGLNDSDFMTELVKEIDKTS